MANVKVNELNEAQSLALTSQLLALTNDENNTVELATVSTLLNNIINTTSENALILKDGKLFISNKGLRPVNVLNGAGSINLESNTVNRVEITGTLEFILPNPTFNVFNQILVQVSMPTLRNVDLGTTYSFNNQLPALTEAGNYNLIYEHDGSNWYVGILTKGEIS